MLALMRRLSEVLLEWLQYTLSDLAIRGFELGKVHKCLWIAIEGREKLAAGLRKLLATMPKVVR